MGGEVHGGTVSERQSVFQLLEGEVWLEVEKRQGSHWEKRNTQGKLFLMIETFEHMNCWWEGFTAEGEVDDSEEERDGVRPEVPGKAGIVGSLEVLA